MPTKHKRTNSRLDAPSQRLSKRLLLWASSRQAFFPHGFRALYIYWLCIYTVYHWHGDLGPQSMSYPCHTAGGDVTGGSTGLPLLHKAWGGPWASSGLLEVHSVWEGGREGGMYMPFLFKAFYHLPLHPPQTIPILRPHRPHCSCP